jgi:hypothetical protein
MSGKKCTESSDGLRWPNCVGSWSRDGDIFDVTQTADGEFWVKVDNEEFIPGMLAGLAGFRERWFLRNNFALPPNNQ